MPGGDRTGPEGRGSRTGRGAGYCSGYSMPGYANPDIPRFGRGFGFGRGRSMGYWRRGRGFWRRGYYPEPYYEPAPSYRDTYSKPSGEEEKTYLEDMIKGLEEEMKELKERLSKISKE